MTLSWNQLGEFINRSRAYLLGNGMDKVLIEALKTMKELPDVKGSEVLEKITRMGIVKRHNGKNILIKLVESDSNTYVV